MSANFNGKDACDQIKENKLCRGCSTTGKVHYIGSEVVRGNPYSPASDTEIDHHYRCDHCNDEWVEYA